MRVITRDHGVEERPGASTSAGGAGTHDRSTGLPAVWLNATLLAFVLVAILLVVDNGSMSVADEAVYATQAQALVDGSWTSPRPVPDLDPDGAMVPLIDSDVIGDRVVAYRRHPLYPVVLMPAIAVGGYSAALFMSCFGTLAAAVCAAFLARRIDVRYGIPALWITGIASPLLFDAVTLWGHSLVAASAGLTTLAAFRVTDGGLVWRHVAYGLPAAVVTVMLRSEGVVFVLALAVVVGATSLRRSIRTTDRTALATGVALGVAAVAAYWLDGRWAASILGSRHDMNVSGLVLAERTGPVKAAWRTLLLPARSPGAPFDRWIVVAMLCVVLSALTVRVLRKWRSVPWALAVVAAGCWAVSLLTTAGDWNAIVAGLFAAWPFLTAGLLLTSRSELRNADVARSLAVTAVAGITLVLSIYSEGGALEWGGRFFHILLLPLVGPAILAFDRSSRRFDRTERRAFVVPLVALLVLPSVVALSWVAQRKTDIAEEVQQLVKIGTRVTSREERPLVVVWRVRPDGTSRSFWSVADRLDVLQTGDLGKAFALTEESTVERRNALIVVTDLPLELFDAVSENLVHRGDWVIDRSEAWADDQLNIIVLRAPDT